MMNPYQLHLTKFFNDGDPYWKQNSNCFTNVLNLS